MTRRALGGLGAAAVLALALVGFAPQAALARTPTIGLSSPADGANLTQSPTVIGQAEMQSGWIDSVKITVESPQGHTVPAPRMFDPSDTPNPLPFQWAPPLAFNGTYKVTAEAVGRDNIELNGPEHSAVTHTFTLNVAPAAPSGVKAVVNQTKRTVTISWTPNPEPDVAGYGVYREEGDTIVERKIVKPDVHTVVDDLGSLPAGTYTYHVYAARPNAAGNEFIPSAPTKVAGKVTSSPPPPPTTTTVKGAAATTTTAPGSKAPALAQRGKADLSGFASLLPSGGGRLPTVRSTPAPGPGDPGYSEDLPFDPDAPGGAADSPAVGDGSDQALGGEALASSSDDEPSGLRFMAAGLLVTVVLMHLLWLRDEVNREPLPAVDVDELAAPAE